MGRLRDLSSCWHIDSSTWGQLWNGDLSQEEEEEGKMEEEWGVERQEVKLVMLMTIAKRAKAEQANDRARVGNVNRQERRDKWLGRS